MLFGFLVLAIKTCKWIEPRSTKTVNGLQGGAKRGFGDRNEFNLKDLARTNVFDSDQGCDILSNISSENKLGFS